MAVRVRRSGMLNVFIASGYIISSVTYAHSFMINFNRHEFQIRNNYRNLKTIKKSNQLVNRIFALVLVMLD